MVGKRYKILEPVKARVRYLEFETYPVCLQIPWELLEDSS
jgi:hypothetical protein